MKQDILVFPFTESIERSLFLINIVKNYYATIPFKYDFADVCQ